MIDNLTVDSFEEILDDISKINSDRSTCICCMENMCNIVFTNCGYTICEKCYEYINHCHICRSKCYSKQKMYFS